MKKGISVLVLLSAILVGFAQQTKLLTAEKHNEYGLVYTLPVTAFEIEIVAVKNIEIAGPFYNYSKIFTTDEKVITEDKVSWNIESVKVTPYGIPDLEQRYLMQLKAGAPTFIQVGEDGMILAINKEIELPKQNLQEIKSVEGTPINGKEYLEFVNDDFISAQSSYKKAQILAEEISEIRDAKISLTRGTAETMPTDGRQLEIMLESLEKQEKALTNAFTGAAWKERTVKKFTVTPEKEGRNVVCRLSLTQGLVNADDYSGEPIYITVSNVEEGIIPVDAKGEEKKLPKDAVMYCVPGVAEINISYLSNTLYTKSFEMSQFGILFGLNPSIFSDKKEPSYAIFDSATGALKELGTLKQ